jgi:tetratricopeptide (TPR) repeat protein
MQQLTQQAQAAQQAKAQAEQAAADERRRVSEKAARSEPSVVSYYRAGQAQEPPMLETYGMAYPEPELAGCVLFAAGRVVAAACAYKQAVKQDLDSERLAECWRMLGQCHAESDDDVAAINSFERAVVAAPANRPALLAFAVSLVNEQKPQKAVSVLRQWVGAHPALAELHAEAAEKTDEPEPVADEPVAAEPEPDAAPVPAVEFEAAEAFGAIKGPGPPEAFRRP